MNWYSRAKFAATPIWNVQYSRDSISSMLYALYELTYKYQYLQHHNFQGYPKRLENILKQIENSARTVIADFVDILVPVFENWLSGHALLTPRTWATKRAKEWFEINGDSPQSLAEMIESECDMQRLRKKFNISPELHRLDEPVKSGQAPVLHKLFETAKHELIEADTENAFYEANRNQEEIDEEQIQAEIKQRYEEMPFSEYLSTWHGDDLAGFLEAASQMYDLEEICIEFAQFLCFPIWYGFWKPQGIDQTRQRIENAYSMLKSVENQPIGQALATINIVINSAHQTGDMLDYIADVTQDSKGEIRHAMDLLSNATEFEEWDLDLREVGLQLPPKTLPTAPLKPITQKPNQVGLPPVARNLMFEPPKEV
jgi:hypothetical protein